MYGDAEQLNYELLRLQHIAESLISSGVRAQVPNRGAFVKNNFSSSLNIETLESTAAKVAQRKAEERRSEKDVYCQLDQYIKSKEKKVSKATLCVYGNVKAHLMAFEEYRQKEITFSSFDFAFYDDFVTYLTFEHVHMRRKTTLVGLKVNTIGKTIKHLRVFIKDRVKRKIIPVDLSDFKILEEEADAIYLSHEEIATIYETDLSSCTHLEVS